MPELALSTGRLVQTESIEKAEYYAKDSLSGYGCHFGGPEMRMCPFLFLQLRDSTERISGEGADADVLCLEGAGIRVIRHPG